MWLERFPSPSNIPDLPSRGRSCDAAQLISGKKVSLDQVAEELSYELIRFEDAAFSFLVSCSDVTVDGSFDPFL